MFASIEAKILALLFFFYKCGNNDTFVATFVATLIKMLDTAALDQQILIAKSAKCGRQKSQSQT